MPVWAKEVAGPEARTFLNPTPVRTGNGQHGGKMSGRERESEPHQTTEKKEGAPIK